jgi:hypothetical protein
MTGTVDSIHQAFAEHRERQRLGPYPRSLRERALRTLNEMELAELGARLKLTSAQVQQWRAKRGASKASAKVRNARKKPPVKNTAFYEVPAAVITPPTQRTTEIEVTIELAGGAKMQIKGPFANDFLRTLLTDLQAVARAA